jgi:monooxygenase
LPPETLTTATGPEADPSAAERVDVLIIGAGISGIGAAHHLQERCPGKSYAILEAREAIGGTWDLFRYPGIRSDSDMHTLGYRFRPWTAAKSIADGASILDYVRDTAREGGIEEKVRFGHRAVKASWSSEEARWTVTVERADGSTGQVSCAFLFNCSGYYRYDEGFTPEFAGVEDFEGQLIHPQHWPEDADYAGKKVVVIGSGATAVTLVPAMAKDAAHVTMLQRSPTYVVSLPGEDAVAEALRKFLPHRAVYSIVRWKNVLIQSFTYRLSRSRPGFFKKVLRKGLEKALPPGYDIDTHFKPKYNPWDQRLCVVPDGDLFKALRDGSAEIVTDHIERFTAKGIKLESGKELEADVVVTATGLNLQFLGGMKLEIDGTEPDQGKMMIYRGMMIGDVPNLAFTIGYTNASWTLKADLVAEFA